jgi:hypothetical protein
MPAEGWARLTAALVIPYQAHREARLHIARGAPPGASQPAATRPRST